MGTAARHMVLLGPRRAHGAARKLLFDLRANQTAEKRVRTGAEPHVVELHSMVRLVPLPGIAHEPARILERLAFRRVDVGVLESDGRVM